MKCISLCPIGVIHTPFTDIKNMPIQPLAAASTEGKIELLPEYVAGLKDIEGFSHITLIYHFHKIQGFELQVVPFMDNEEHGIFATKSPKRPNALGISTVKLLRIEGHVIYVEQVDMLDGTPLLDIKPFFPRYDNRQTDKIGWLEKNKNMPVDKLKADERFR